LAGLLVPYGLVLCLGFGTYPGHGTSESDIVGCHVLGQIPPLCGIQPIGPVPPGASFVYPHLIVDKGGPEIGGIVLSNKISCGITAYGVLWGIVHLSGFFLLTEFAEEPGRTRVPVPIPAVVTLGKVCPQISILVRHGNFLDFTGKDQEDRKSTRLNSSHVKISY